MVADPKIRADEISCGDLVDLHGDPYADPDMDPGSGFEFSYAEVERVERETPGCLLIVTDLSAFGCPPDHLVYVNRGAAA